MLKLETLMENAVDKNFDKLEIWTLRNVLCLPRGEEELARWVRLGHYEVCVTCLLCSFCLVGGRGLEEVASVCGGEVNEESRIYKRRPRTRVSHPKPSTRSAADSSRRRN